MSKDGLISELQSIVGREHLLTGERSTRRYRTGFRFGQVRALTVVRPGSLVELWRVLKVAVAAEVAIIVQAANTGLTGGSTPSGEYDRPVLIINTMRLSRIDTIHGAKEIVAFPGATLDRLTQQLKPFGREPHSVIGSTSIGASIVGGVCNNSGGSLVQRGPAYTEMSLYAELGADGTLRLVNHLGISLGETPEDILRRLDAGAYDDGDIEDAGERRASDRAYQSHVRDIQADTPARYNGDPRLHFEASGSAGKIVVFALRLDTFAKQDNTRVFYIGTNDPDELTRIRRHILSSFENLPIAGEYMQREGFELAERYGKDVFLLIKHFGTNAIPKAFGLKNWFDGITERLGFGVGISDRLIQALMRITPNHLPKPIRAYNKSYEHHLIIRMGGKGVEEARTYLSSIFPTAYGDFFECSDAVGDAAFLHRFTFGGVPGRYKAAHSRQVEDILALDVALPRNTMDWLPELPEDINSDLVARSVCGHFFCHVLHQEYLVRKGVSVADLKARMLQQMDEKGIRYPAEHNVGHLYDAPLELKKFYRRLDPTNTFNPGIGKTSRRKNWQ